MAGIPVDPRAITRLIGIGAPPAGAAYRDSSVDTGAIIAQGIGRYRDQRDREAAMRLENARSASLYDEIAGNASERAAREEYADAASRLVDVDPITNDITGPRRDFVSGGIRAGIDPEDQALQYALGDTFLLDNPATAEHALDTIIARGYVGGRTPLGAGERVTTSGAEQVTADALANEISKSEIQAAAQRAVASTQAGATIRAAELQAGATVDAARARGPSSSGGASDIPGVRDQTPTSVARQFLPEGVGDNVISAIAARGTQIAREEGVSIQEGIRRARQELLVTEIVSPSLFDWDGRRQYRLRSPEDEIAGTAPAAPAAPPAAAPPAASPSAGAGYTADENGVVYDAQGRRIGTLPRGR